MSLLRLWPLLLLLGYPLPGHAEMIYRKGCETPLPGTQLCWEAMAEEESMVSPYEEVHLLPIMQGGRNPQPLVELTRTVYRQIMPGEFSRQIYQEWEPQASHLDEAMEISRRTNWPLLLWISPRTMRNGSAMTPALVEWDVYLINPVKSRPERTLRIRAESRPKPGKDTRMERGASSYALLRAVGAAAQLSMFQTAAVVGVAAAADGDTTPPQSGLSMELLTELAVRQILFLSQHNITEINPPVDPAKMEMAEMTSPTSGSTLAKIGSSE